MNSCVLKTIAFKGIQIAPWQLVRKEGALLKASIHDSTQLEITSTMQLDPGQTSTLDVYFVVPPQMARSYERSAVFQDVLVRRRLHTPRRRVFIDKLKESLRALERFRSDSYSQEKHRRPAVYFLRLYGNFLNRRFKSILVALQTEGADVRRRVQRFSKELEWFRGRVFAQYSQEQLGIPRSLTDAVRAVDEFISNRIFWVLGRQVARLRKREQKADSDDIHGVLSSLLDRELIHRRRQGYPCTRLIADPVKREQAVERHATLKKYVAAPLFVSMDRRSQETVYRNFFAAIAAGLAATWSFLAEMQTYRMAEGQDFGFKTALVMALVVFAYILKDRLKENSRDFLSSRLNHSFPDYRSSLWIRNELQAKVVLGATSEAAEYSSIRALPDEVRTLYRLHEEKDVPRHKNKRVLHYNLCFEAEKSLTLTSFDREMKEIIRYDVRRLTRALDDSLKSLAVFGGETEAITELEAGRVYSVDLLLRSRRGDETQVAHYRLQLQRKGIARLVALVPATQLRTRENRQSEELAYA